MDMEVLKKKISTFRGEGGRVKITDDSLLMEILYAWEQWTGLTREFYRSIGVSQKGMASIIGRAKKLRREGHFPVQDFKEITVSGSGSGPSSGEGMGSGLGLANCNVVELTWSDGRVIRFGQVDSLIDFLKKVA